MGAAESILGYEEEAPSHDAIDHASSSRREEQNVPQQNKNEPTQSQQAPAASNVPRRIRQRPPSQLVASTPICRLHGSILGLTSSGKGTLLRRLKGHDPFVDQEPLALGQKVRDAPLSSKAEKTEETRPTSITVPYQPPVKAWDSIQLDVKVQAAIHEEQPTDFLVVLVHPEQKRKRVKKHLKETLQTLLHLRGYRKLSDEAEGEEEEEPDQQEPNPATESPRPICLCILINFRDLQSNTDNRSASFIDTSDITEITMQVLQDYPVEPERLVLVCGHVSLFNCYGLQLLHSFIYQAYLQRKRMDTEALLKDINHARRIVKPHVEMEYDDYVNTLLKQAQNQQTTVESRKRNQSSRAPNDDVVVSNQAILSDRRQVLPKATMKQSHAPSVGSTAATHVPPSTQESKQRNNAAAAKLALEAFLADSDSDEDQYGKTAKESQQKSPTNNDDDETESDDDEVVFYDGTTSEKPSRDSTEEGAQGRNKRVLIPQIDSVNVDDEKESVLTTTADLEERPSSKDDSIAAKSEKEINVVEDQREVTTGSVSTADSDSASVSSHPSSSPSKETHPHEESSLTPHQPSQPATTTEDDSSESSDSSAAVQDLSNAGAQQVQQAETDSDDDDDYVIETSTAPSSTTRIASQQTDSHNDDDDDDDDFVIETTVSSSATTRVSATQSHSNGSNGKSTPSTPTSTTATTAGNGVDSKDNDNQDNIKSSNFAFTASAEVKAALAAAQRHAEEMLLATTKSNTSDAMTTAAASTDVVRASKSKVKKKKRRAAAAKHKINITDTVES